MTALATPTLTPPASLLLEPPEQRRKLVTELPGPLSRALQQRRNDALPRALGTTEPASQMAKAVAAHCHSRGVVILVCGTFGNVIRLLPPLVIGEELLVEGLDILAEALRSQV